MHWQPAEISTYEDHVIAHVLGAQVLGYFAADEAAHFVLDIGFIWTILLDGKMALVLERPALAELNVGADERAALTDEVQALYETGAAAPLARVTHAPADCTVQAVECYANEAGRRVIINCEGASLGVETVLATGAVEITARPRSSSAGRACSGSLV